MSQTYEPRSVAKEAPGFADVTIKALRERGLLPPRKWLVRRQRFSDAKRMVPVSCASISTRLSPSNRYPETLASPLR